MSISLFSYVSEISKSDMVSFGLVISVIVFLVNKLQITVTTVIGFCTAIVCVYFWYERKRSSAENQYETLTAKILYLSNLTSQRLEYFYTDPEIINFFSSRAYFRRYAADSFDGCLRFVNMFLHLKSDVEIGTVKCQYDVDTAQDMYTNIMNAFSEIHFKLPNDVNILAQHDGDNDYLQLKLLRLMQEMRVRCDGGRLLDQFNIVPPIASDFSDMTLHVPYG